MRVPVFAPLLYGKNRYPGLAVYDRFIGPDALGLALHAPDKRPSGLWVMGAGTVVLAGNKASWATNGGGGYCMAAIESGKSDCVVSAVVSCSVANNMGLLVRYSDANNYFGLLADPGQDRLLIIKRAAGVLTVPATQAAATVTINTGIDYLLSVLLSGDDMTITVNGGTPLTLNDAFNNTATKHGLYCENATLFDEFKVA